MRLSNLFAKTTKQISAEEVSKNAQLLIRAGYVDKLTAGVYSYLPLGLKVLINIAQIVREEMDGIGAQEILMPSLHPKANWEKTGRWDTYDTLFKTSSRWGKAEYALGPTHEEVVTPLIKKHVQSYKDFPLAVYQIQTKFRDEARSKSGLLRGREFYMKDLYSFHRTEEDRQAYYDRAIEAYKRVYERCGFSEIIVTESGGGDFTDKHSHEFQVITDAGEDTIILCRSCNWAENTEITDLRKGSKCPNCAAKVEEVKAIEAGNIFDLGDRFAKDFDLTYQDENGKRQYPIIGCYGLGISRTMGALVEDQADEKGLVWPVLVAPYTAHIVILGDNKDVQKQGEKLYKDLQKAGISVLLDDREVSNGEKLGDADLLGMPVRLVISEKTKDKVELKLRVWDETELLETKQVINKLEDIVNKSNT